MRPADGGATAPPLRLRADASILVLQLQQVGDSLMMAPVLRSLRRRYPHAIIDVLTTPVVSAAYRRCPHVSRVRVVDAAADGRSRLGRAARWWGVLRQLRRARYECVLACRNHVSAPYVAVATLCGARHTVGFDEGSAGFLFSRRLRVIPGTNVLRTNAALAAAVDAEVGELREEFWYGAEEQAAIETLLARSKVAAAARIAVLHPASNWQSKTWYVDRWAAVADWLAVDRGLTPVFVGRARDAEVIRAVQEHMTTASHSVAGETDLCQLGALMARAEIFVGTDSGPRHVAGALSRPQVTVMSSLDDPVQWTLDRPGELLLRSDPPCRGCLQSYCSHRLCLDLISVDQVIAACRIVLDRRGAARAPGLTRSA